MNRTNRDPFGAMKKAVIALCIFLFVFLALTVVVLLHLSGVAEERERRKAVAAQASDEDSVHDPDDEREAQRMELAALEYVLAGNFRRLDELSEESAGMTPQVRAVLLDRWDQWDLPAEEERLVGLAGLLRAAIAGSGAFSPAMFRRTREKLTPLLSCERAEFRRVALRTCTEFPPHLAEKGLLEAYAREPEPEIRAFLVQTLRDRANGASYNRVLRFFRESEDPAPCAEAAIILAGIHARRPNSLFDGHRKHMLLPKLRAFEESPVVRRALDAPGE